MGFLDELKKLTKPYEEDEFFDDDDSSLEEDDEPTIIAPKTERAERPERTERKERKERFSPFDDEQAPIEFSEKPVSKDNKVVNIHTTTAVQVVLSKPERFEQAAEIADHLRDKRTVVMNLETTNKDVARRLVDFLSGVAYANDGKIKKVAINTYIVTPYNVDIMGDLLDELENNGVYI